MEEHPLFHSLLIHAACTISAVETVSVETVKQTARQRRSSSSRMKKEKNTVRRVKRTKKKQITTYIYIYIYIYNN
jgi:hypothetical protein